MTTTIVEASERDEHVLTGNGLSLMAIGANVRQVGHGTATTRAGESATAIGQGTMGLIGFGVLERLIVRFVQAL